MQRRTLGIIFVSATTLFACSDDGPGSEGGADANTGGGSDGGGGGGGGEWQTLIEGDWTLPAGTEGYYCVKKTIEQDLYISDFRAIAPEGTHHTVLTLGNPSGTDGVYPCSAGENHQAMVYGSGVGTDPFSFPEGVAVHIPAGKQLLINLHLFNVGDAEIQGISGTEVKTMAQDEVVHLAEAILAGKTFGLTVPPGTSTQVGHCRMNGDVTLLSLSPHMHQLGAHTKVYAEVGNDETLLLDEPYDFYDQRIYPLQPALELSQGDKLRVECSYDNDTGKTVNFGDSSTQEMCFVGVYRYPAYGATFGFVCDDSTSF